MKYEDRLKQKLLSITDETLVVGIDIAKHDQWARFVDYRGIEHSNALKFSNDECGFNAILTKIKEICKQENFTRAVIGMEPTGHYWKPLANFLTKQENIVVVLVNPYATKKAKELDDNSPTKSDRKDALTIARLVKDGRFFESYLPHDVYGELRVLSTERIRINKRKNALKNMMTAILDEYFPEFVEVFRCPFKGKASLHILKKCPFPKDILKLGIDGVIKVIKESVKKTVGRKKATMLVEAAKKSVGVDYGEESAAFKLRNMIEEWELLNKQMEELEKKMSEALSKTGYKDILLSVKGIGIVNLSACLGELGDPKRFENPRQMSRLAGYNLKEDSSGRNKSGTCISKRGRKGLRNILYLMALTMISVNNEMKALYKYLRTREKNPLKKLQAMVVISKKILTIIFTLTKKKEMYNPEKVFGKARKNQLQTVA